MLHRGLGSVVVSSAIVMCGYAANDCPLSYCGIFSSFEEPNTTFLAFPATNIKSFCVCSLTFKILMLLTSHFPLSLEWENTKGIGDSLIWTSHDLLIKMSILERFLFNVHTLLLIDSFTLYLRVLQSSEVYPSDFSWNSHLTFWSYLGDMDTLLT